MGNNHLDQRAIVVTRHRDHAALALLRHHAHLAGADEQAAIRADGSGRVALTHILMSAVVEGRGPWNDTAPAWSPNGGQIAFLTDRAGRWEVWVMNADGSD